MLKISVTPVGNDDQLETAIESSGPLDDVVAELGLAVLRMHQGLAQANKVAGKRFRAAVVMMFSDPDFWEHAPDGEMLECNAVLSEVPKRKQ